MSQPSLTRLRSFYLGLDTTPLLRVMINQEFPGKIALISSFGADAVLLLSLVAEVNPATPVLFLDTGKHFDETLDYVEEVTEHLGLSDVRWLKPQMEMVKRIDAEGNLWSRQPNRCCWLRKVEPLDRAMQEMGFQAVITGRKRYQTAERNSMETIEQDDKGIIRINPLAYWSKEQIRTELAQRRLPSHPLIAKGYLSIGCAPCTQPIAEGQDERAGRWAHTAGFDEEQKTECGIHLAPEETTWSV